MATIPSLPCFLDFDHLRTTLNINYEPVRLEKLYPGRPLIYTNQTVPTISGTFQSFVIEESQIAKIYNWFDTGSLLYKIPHFNQVPHASPKTSIDLLSTPWSALCPQSIVFVVNNGSSVYKRHHFPHAHFGVLGGNAPGGLTLLNPGTFKVEIAPTQDFVDFEKHEGLLTVGNIDWQVVPRNTQQNYITGGDPN